MAEKKMINPEERYSEVCKVIGELKTKEQIEALKKIIEREKNVPQNHENTQKRYEQQVERGKRGKFNPKITKPSNVTFTIRLLLK